jgi:hypothetical protein
MVDTGQDIVVPDEMTITELEELQADTQNRFTWEFTANPLYVKVSYVNYIKPRKKDANGAWKLRAHVNRAVKIK